MAAQHSLRSTIEMLAMGVPPTQVLASQMNHLSYAATGPGGLKAAFGEVMGMIGGMITPMRLLAGGVIATGAGVGMAAMDWREGEKDITRSLLGIGKASGATADDIIHFSASSALATRESFATARSVATELVSSSGVASDHLNALTTDTLQFAKAMNISSDEAAKFMSAAIIDPAKGMEQINDKIQFLDNSTRHYVKTLVDAGDMEKARSVIIEKMTPAIIKAGEATDGWAVSWHGLKTIMSDSSSYVGSLFGKGTDQQQLDALKERRASIAASEGGSAAGLSGIYELNNQIDKLEQKIKSADEASKNAKFTELANAADGIVTAFVPAISKIETLQGAIEKLEKAKQDANVSGLQSYGADNDRALITMRTLEALTIDQADAAERHNKAVSEIALNYKGVSTQTALALDLQKQELAVARAVTGQEKLAAQEALNRYHLMVDQGKSAPDASAIASGARANAEAQIKAQIEGQLVAMQGQLSIAQAVTGQQQLTAQADATRNAILRDIGDATLANAAADMQREISEARINSQIENQIVGLDQQTRLIYATAQGAGAAASAAIAYENAIRAGANATEAAALASATLAANTAKAAAASYQASQQMHYASGGPQEFGNQFGNQEVGLPGTSGTDLQQAIWKANYGPGGFNTFINGGFGINGGRFDVSAIPNDQGLQYMYSQTLKSAAEKNMDAVTKAKFEAGVYKLPQSQAQSIANAFLQQNNYSTDVNAQKAAADFVSQSDSSSSSSTSNSLINPMYTSGSSSVIGFRAATGIDFTVPGTGPTDSVRVEGRVSPGERMIVVPPGGQVPGVEQVIAAAKARAAINQRIVIQAASMRGASDTMPQLMARLARAASAAARHR
jgi:hypothetical protein